MKKVIATTVVSLLAGSLSAAESDFEVSVDAGVFSKYVWRGINTSDEPVNQGSIDISTDIEDVGVFGFNAWYNQELTAEPGNGDGGDFTEVDLTLYWSMDYEDVSLGAGLIYYEFPYAGDETTEVYFSAALPDVILAPSATVYLDLDEQDGIYLDLGISHSFAMDQVAEGVTLDLAANLGIGDDRHNDFYYSSTAGKNAGSGLANVLLSASMPLPVSDQLTVTPGLAYSSLVDDAKARGVDRDEVVFSLNASYSF